VFDDYFFSRSEIGKASDLLDLMLMESHTVQLDFEEQPEQTAFSILRLVPEKLLQWRK
jgi:hypothetical protein